MLKMAEAWIEHLVEVLKHLESEANSKQVHQFRRSFQGGNKKTRLLPQLQQIYEECHAHLDDVDFQEWFNQRRYNLTLGRKTITLRCTQALDSFKTKLLRLFTYWNSDLAQNLPAQTSTDNNNMGFSRKQMRLAKRRLNHMGDQQLTSLMQKVPSNANINSDQLSEVFDQRSADRIQNAMH